MKKSISTISIFLLLCVLCIQCQSKTKSTNIDQSDMIPETMQETLKKQLLYGANRYSIEVGLEYPHPNFNKDDFNASVYFSDKILTSNGYKNLTNKDFSKKVQEIFGRIIDWSSTSTSLYVNFLEKCNRTYRNEIQDKINVYGTYVVKDQNFIMDFHYIPELMDYIKEYPKIVSIEDTMTVKRDNIFVERWKELAERTDEYNLAKNRKYYQDQLIHRNKYLFNNSNASLTWLMNNDKLFLESLVTTFGYVQDEKLLKWVIDNNLYTLSNNNLLTVSTILTNKRCDGTWVFNQEVLDLMDKYYKDDYYRSIMDFILEYDNKQEEFDMPFPKKAEMIAKLLSWIESKADMNNHEYPGFQMGAFFYASNMGEKYEKEFEKNDYYNLPNFEDYWEVGKGTFK